MQSTESFRIYSQEDVVSSRKTAEPFGGLSNMAAGYPIVLGNLTARTTEALYQACRFPQDPDLQRKILSEKSPMTAKMVGKPFWDVARVRIMRWCLRLKLTQHWRHFGNLLESTEGRDIVENSRKDRYWGAVPNGNQLVGHNVLGRLLMELRSSKAQGLENMVPVKPPSLTTFLLLGEDISAVDARGKKVDITAEASVDENSAIVDTDSNKLYALERNGDVNRVMIVDTEKLRRKNDDMAHRQDTDSRERIRRVVVDEISKHLRFPLREKELAEKLGVSPSQMRLWLNDLIIGGVVTKAKSHYHLQKAIDESPRADQLALLPTEDLAQPLDSATLA